MFGRQNLALTFIILTVTLDAMGIGLIFPVMPDLMMQVTRSACHRLHSGAGPLSPRLR